MLWKGSFWFTECLTYPLCWGVQHCTQRRRQVTKAKLLSTKAFFKQSSTVVLWSTAYLLPTELKWLEPSLLTQGHRDRCTHPSVSNLSVITPSRLFRSQPPPSTLGFGCCHFLVLMCLLLIASAVLCQLFSFAVGWQNKIMEFVKNIC